MEATFLHTSSLVWSAPTFSSETEGDVLTHKAVSPDRGSLLLTVVSSERKPVKHVRVTLINHDLQQNWEEDTDQEGRLMHMFRSPTPCTNNTPGLPVGCYSARVTRKNSCSHVIRFELKKEHFVNRILEI